MIIVSFFLYREKYTCFSFRLVLYVEGAFLNISLRMVPHPRREEVFVFSFFQH